MDLPACVFVVEDDSNLAEHLRILLESAGFRCQAFTTAEQFLAAYNSTMPGCLLLDVHLPSMSGEALQTEFIRRNIKLPIIFLSAYGDIPLAVRLVKAGAVDFLPKPVSADTLIPRVKEVLAEDARARQYQTERFALQQKVLALSGREHEIMLMALQGMHNKDIARKLSISHRTVEVHRRKILKKMEVATFLELANLFGLDKPH
jgi:two-component system, LuxR family, response regulator FixJ